MKILKVTLFIMLAFVCLVSSLAVNIYLHEYGHYAVAKEYNLDPEMHFEVNEPEEGALFYTTSFYTEYTAPAEKLTDKDANIAFAGPAVNMIIALLFGIAYLLVPKDTPRKRLVATILILFLIPSVLSVIVNIIPFTGTDGSMIFQYLTS
jgi:Zn-dependent protease